MSGAKFFTKTDLARSYWQAPLEVSSKRYTAFSSKEGHFQWNYLRFGLGGTPVTFTRLIKKLTVDRQDIVSHLGDVLLVHATLEEHLHGLQRDTR